jgi:hypothetical protein
LLAEYCLFQPFRFIQVIDLSILTLKLTGFNAIPRRFALPAPASPDASRGGGQKRSSGGDGVCVKNKGLPSLQALSKHSAAIQPDLSHRDYSLNSSSAGLTGNLTINFFKFSALQVFLLEMNSKGVILLDHISFKV